MSRILIVGLPRSGTTWLAENLGAAPGVRYVFEPDTQNNVLARLGTHRLELHPDLSPGDRASEYHMLWEIAFAGGLSSRGLSSARLVLRLGKTAKLPLRRRVAFYRRVGRIAVRRDRPSKHVLVKSVFACHTLEWIEREFEPVVVVVWRHPLNLVTSWRGMGWNGEIFLGSGKVVRARFEECGLWPPPPAEEGLARTAWIACAESVVLLETADRHPEWIIVGHEAQCMDPVRGFHELFAQLGIEPADGLDQRLALSNSPGSGYETNRRRADEPLRWRSRLTESEQQQVGAIVQAFERASPVAAAAWQASPAMDLDRTR